MTLLKKNLIVIEPIALVSKPVDSYWFFKAFINWAIGKRYTPTYRYMGVWYVPYRYCRTINAGDIFLYGIGETLLKFKITKVSDSRIFARSINAIKNDVEEVKGRVILLKK